MKLKNYELFYETRGVESFKWMLYMVCGLVMLMLTAHYGCDNPREVRPITDKLVVSVEKRVNYHDCLKSHTQSFCWNNYKNPLE